MWTDPPASHKFGEQTQILPELKSGSGCRRQESVPGSKWENPVQPALIAAGIITDSWIGAMPAGRAPASVMPPATLANRVVMELPTGDVEDIPATYWAAIGGWTSINGYSGYHPNYYSALNYSVRFEEDSAVLPFQARTELDVLVPTRAPA